MPLVLGGEKIVALILYTSTHTLAWKENFFWGGGSSPLNPGAKTANGAGNTGFGF